MYPLTLDRANQILDALLIENDNQHAAELLELVHGISSPESLVALYIKKRLFMSIEAGEAALENHVKGFGVAMASAASS
jgi:hypothetical protein